MSEKDDQWSGQRPEKERVELIHDPLASSDCAGSETTDADTDETASRDKRQMKEHTQFVI